MNQERKIVHTRHVLGAKDLKIESDYYIHKLGFDPDFTARGWEFLSFGDFKVMLGECADEMAAAATGDHSWFAHVLVENVDDDYEEVRDCGADTMPLYQVEQYRDNLMKLRGIVLDVGEFDEFTHIRKTTAMLSGELSQREIPHVFEIYRGGDHGNKIRERFNNKVMPFFTAVLEK